MLSAARVHALLRALPVSTLDAQMAGAPILVLAPHPDDESLGCGGLIAQARSAGQKIAVLVLTDGSRSHPRSREYPAQRLRRLREREVLEAGQVLGLEAGDLHFLGLPDGRAPRHGAAAERAVRNIADLASRMGAQSLLTTWRHDPHCDHQTASLLARKAASLTGSAVFEYPIWGWTLPPRRLLLGPPPSGFRLDVRAQLARKRRAIATHRSQLGQVVADDPAGFTLEQKFIDLFTGDFETFVSP